MNGSAYFIGSSAHSGGRLIPGWGQAAQNRAKLPEVGFPGSP